MALGKYSRVDGRKSSSYCSTVTVVVFVALCLVGVWMMTSSSPSPSIVPLQNSDVSSQGKRTDLTTQVSKESGSSENAVNESNPTDDGKSKQFEDNPGDLPEDATKGDASVSKEEINSNSQQKEDAKSEIQSESETDKEDGEPKVEDKDSEAGESKSVGEETGEGSDGKKSEMDDGEKKSEEKLNGDSQKKDQSPDEVFPSGAQSDLLNETTTQNGAFSTQASESKNEKEKQESSESDKGSPYIWKVCNSTAGPDYIPCLDNLEAIRNLRSTKHYEHRERHCPDNPPTCLVPLPEGYQRSVEWPTSREKIWYHNVPHTKLAEVKGHQNWVKVSGEYLTFPGGGTQFKHGALHYIDFIQQSIPDIAWGKQTRVILDVGCGVASFGGFLFDRDVLTMSFAPKDEHEAQVQFALERGIPAISAVMGTKRLPFPSRVFDAVHCARCRVPWHIEGVIHMASSLNAVECTGFQDVSHGLEA